MRILRVKAVLLATLGAIALAGCNAIAGVGRDISSAGDTIEDAAD